MHANLRRNAAILGCVVVLLMCLPALVSATLTEQQSQKLKEDILITHANEFAPLVAQNDYGAIAKEYNLPSSPPFWVWRTSLREQEVYEATVEGASWNWGTYKGQPAADRDAWGRMWNPGVVNPSLKQTREGWATIFGTQGQSQAQINYLLALARRVATRGEALLANTSTGNGSPATPATATLEGHISYDDVRIALTLTPS